MSSTTAATTPATKAISGRPMSQKDAKKKKTPYELEREAVMKKLVSEGSEVYQRYNPSSDSPVKRGELKAFLFPNEQDVYAMGKFGSMQDTVDRASLRCLFAALCEALTSFRDDKRWCAVAFSKKMWTITELPWFQQLIDSMWVLAHVADEDGSDLGRKVLSNIFAWKRNPRKVPRECTWETQVLRVNDDTDEELTLASYGTLIRAICFRIRESAHDLEEGYTMPDGTKRSWVGLSSVQAVLAYIVSEMMPRLDKIFDPEPWASAVDHIQEEAHALWVAKEAEYVEKKKTWVPKKSGQGPTDADDASAPTTSAFKKSYQPTGKGKGKGKRQHDKFRNADKESGITTSSMMTPEQEAGRKMKAEKQKEQQAEKAAKEAAEMEELQKKAAAYYKEKAAEKQMAKSNAAVASS
jgi:hypothetical protein